MPREADPSINEAEFVHASLRKGIRLDGRSMYDMRKVQLRFSDQLGWVECRLGKTRCADFYCRLQCEASGLRGNVR